MSAMSYIKPHPKTKVYRIRRAIPEKARYAFDGKLEYIETLGTKNFKEAQSKGFPILAWLQHRLDNALAGTLIETDEHAADVACSFIDWDGRNGGTGFLLHDTPYIFDGQEEFINRLKEYCVECGIPTDGNAFDEIENVVECEINHLYERSSAPKPTHQTQKVPTPPLPPKNALDGISEQVTLSQLCERLFKYKPKYIGKTKRDAKRAFSDMIELHGDLLLTDVKKAHVREYRDILLRMPVTGRTKKVQEMPLREVVKKDWPHTISRDTIMKLLGFISQGFVIAVSEDWAYENPREGLLIPIIETSQTVVRREFRPHELEIIFTSPLFNKCSGTRKEAISGTMEIRDYRYWLPLVALYTGARLAELCQLEKTNLRQDGNIWYLEITEVSDDTKADKKSLKTKGSKRNVPVHSILIDKGFITYAQSGKNLHIFKSRYATQRQLAHEYSKWFGRYLSKISLDDKSIVFHSFRHNFITACRRANIVKEIWENFTGHKPQDVGGKYGKHDRLMDQLKEKIDRVEYEGIG